jgi:hypothetical protein
VVGDARFPPGFGASLVGVAAGFLGGAVLTAILAWPFALASWSALAVGGATDDDAGRRFLLVVVMLVALQLVLSSWIAQQAASLFGDGTVRYRRALGALLLGAVATLVAAVTFPAGAALPLVGHSWVGILLAAWVISSGPPAPRAR